jgi:hypothetical protein
MRKKITHLTKIVSSLIIILFFVAIVLIFFIEKNVKTRLSEANQIILNTIPYAIICIDDGYILNDAEDGVNLIPEVGKPICQNSKIFWPQLPKNWSYVSVLSSIQSRNLLIEASGDGYKLSCDESGCKYEDSK